MLKLQEDLESFARTEERFKERNENDPPSISYIYMTHKDAPDAFDDGINTNWFDKIILEQIIEDVVIDDDD